MLAMGLSLTIHEPFYLKQFSCGNLSMSHFAGFVNYKCGWLEVCESEGEICADTANWRQI